MSVSRLTSEIHCGIEMPTMAFTRIIKLCCHRHLPRQPLSETMRCSYIHIQCVFFAQVPKRVFRNGFTGSRVKIELIGVVMSGSILNAIIQARTIFQSMFLMYIKQGGGITAPNRKDLILC